MEDLQLQHVFQCFQLLRAVLFVFMWEQPTHPLLGPFTARARGVPAFKHALARVQPGGHCCKEATGLEQPY